MKFIVKTFRVTVERKSPALVSVSDRRFAEIAGEVDGWVIEAECAEEAVEQLTAALGAFFEKGGEVRANLEVGILE